MAIPVERNPTCPVKSLQWNFIVKPQTICYIKCRLGQQLT